MFVYSAIILLVTTVVIDADYECLCNYSEQRVIYSSKKTQGNPLGYMYEFDCKATYKDSTPGWQAIQYEKQVGYIVLDQQTQIQTCPGEPNIEDRVPTTTSIKPPITTFMPTETPLSTAMYIYTSRYTPTVENKTTNSIGLASTTDLSTASASSTIRVMVTDVTTSPAIDHSTVTHRPTAVTVLSQSQSTAHKSTNFTTASTFKVISSATAANLPTVTTPTAIDPTTVTHRPTAVTVLSQSQLTAHNLINYTTAPTFKVTSSATATNLPTVTTPPSIAHSTLTHRPAVVTGLSQSQSTAHKSSKYTSASIFTDTSSATATNLPTISTSLLLHTSLNLSSITPQNLMISSTSNALNTSNTILSGYSTKSSTLNIVSTTSNIMSAKPAQTLGSEAPITAPTSTPLETSSTSMSTITATKRLPECPRLLPRTQFLKEHGSHCYEFILGRAKEWQNAENDCQSKGGHLVTIRSYDEQNFIYQTLTSLNFHGDAGVWIGLTDQDREGHWQWSSGENVVFTSWAKHEPGLLFAIEDCALFDMRVHGHWGDYKCKGILFNHQAHGWICEYRLQ